MVAASVVGIPCGNPGVDLQGAVLDELGPTAHRRPGRARSWSSSPCITSTGTEIALRSSVKSVWEKATMPS